MILLSKVVAIELENFMSIGSARLEFDATGILNITGYNDSGKSAITRALEVLFYDAYSNDQVNFIRDGQPHFGIGLEFDDGVSINKFKYAGGPSVWEMYKEGQLVYTNRLSDGIASLQGIPDPIVAYLGVVQDDFTGEQLNVRRNTDKLFLIHTTGGDNYKIINSLLRCDVLAESVKRMNEDRNRLQAEVTNKATVSLTLKAELNDLVVLDEAGVALVTQGVGNLRLIKQQTEFLISITSLQRQIADILVYEELPSADSSRLRAISELLTLKSSADLPLYPEAPPIDLERLKVLSVVLESRQALQRPVPDDCGLLNTQQVKDIKAVGEAYNHWWGVQSQLTAADKEYQELHEQLHALSKQFGYKVCKNCGSLVS